MNERKRMRGLSQFESWLTRAGAGLLSGSTASRSLLILIYHRVLAAPDPLLPGEPDAAEFLAQMSLISSTFNVMPLSEAVGRLRSGTLPRRAISVTFDDGYANNCEIGLPILLAQSIPATIFVAAGFLNGGIMFNDIVIETIRQADGELDLRALGLPVFDLSDAQSKLRAIETIIGQLKYLEPAERQTRAHDLAHIADVALPNNLMMVDAQVQQLASAGIEIGAHTTTHPILTRVDEHRAREEMESCKRSLERLTGTAVRSFAYPNGKPGTDYHRTHVAMARQTGFDFALSTAWGAATIGTDRYQLPRIAPWDSDPRRYALRLAIGYRQRTLPQC